MSVRFAFAVSGLLLLTSGCGESAPPPPTLVPVAGKVTMDGKPFDGCMVTFLPRGATKSQVAYGVTDESGAFSLKYAAGGEGCPTGEYKAIFSKLRTPEGQPIPEGKTAADVNAVDKVPMAYRTDANELHVVQVSGEGKSDLAFNLKSK
jgi:hypothetical protein